MTQTIQEKIKTTYTPYPDEKPMKVTVEIDGLTVDVIKRLYGSKSKKKVREVAQYTINQYMTPDRFPTNL